MSRLLGALFGALFAVYDAARIVGEDTSKPTHLMELSETEQQWMAWGNEHIHPGTGNVLRQGNAPSSLVEDEASPLNYLAAAAGAMMEPGSRTLVASILRGVSRQSSPFEGPTPTCPDMPMCAALMENRTNDTCNTVVYDSTSPLLHLVGQVFVSFNCPVSCNTSLEHSYCVVQASPCSDTIAECEHGYRPRTECVQQFSYQHEIHEGCKHDGPLVWCPPTYNVNASTMVWPCHECTELPVATEPGNWETIAKKLRCIEIGVTAGDAMERRYTFLNRGRHLSVQQPLASQGKWLAAVSLAAAVHRGILEWDTLASDVFSWWTKDASDPRSRVSFRHLMNFNSGFYLQNSLMAFSHNGFEERCLTWGFAMMWTPVSCAQQLYDQVPHAGEPGHYFDYNSYHLQIALGMVVQASGIEAREWLRVTLLEPAGMADTYWMGGSNPLLSSGIVSTPNDHDLFLRKYLAYEILPKEILDVVETEVLAANNVSLEYTSMNFSSFAMGHWRDGDYSRMGGAVYGGVNRRANVYVGVYMPLDSYADGPERFTIDWIKDDVEKAVHSSLGVH